MSSLQNIKRSTVLIPYFKSSPYAQKTLNLLDVGSRGGYENHWRQFKPELQVLGFEADEDECNRLNIENSAKLESHLPNALGEKNQAGHFYLYKNQPSSSFFPPNDALVQRFADYQNLRIESSIELRTSSLDELLLKQSVSEFDFLKMDAEGYVVN